MSLTLDRSTAAGTAQGAGGDPLMLAVLANRFDGIVREMTNTLMRSARSAVICIARDFSCTIVTADNQLLSAAEGVPVHIFGSHLQCESMTRLHSDIEDGDAFLHNDPYLGNTHAADHTILVPVFVEGEHLFTVSAKAHQADIGNGIPTTYHAWAKDVYEEGALVFPCVRIQRRHVLNEDIVRMCKARIRIPDQWHGDFLAMVGAARIGERRLKEVCGKYGVATVKQFVRDWLDYSERRMQAAIRRLPAGRLSYQGAHDPIQPHLPEGVPIKVDINVDPEGEIIEIDLRDNIDCVDNGLNQSESCAISNVLAGVFNCLEHDIPHNSGCFRRLRVLLRDGCVVGRPTFPHSCSASTTNLGPRLANFAQACFSKLGDGYGLAEGGGGSGVGRAVISGQDFRRDGEGYINQLWISLNGGPGGPAADGWVNHSNPNSSGMLYRDSIELDEIKHPITFKRIRILTGSGGAGRFRGAPGTEVVYGPKRDSMHAIISCDAQHFPPRGVHGGEDGIASRSFLVHADGQEEQLPNFVELDVAPGQFLRGIDNSGGGYGDPFTRAPERVLKDVLDRWETLERARSIYGVAFSISTDGELVIDPDATARLRYRREPE